MGTMSSGLNSVGRYMLLLWFVIRPAGCGLRSSLQSVTREGRQEEGKIRYRTSRDRS